MIEFQTELDTAIIDFNHSIKSELQAILNAYNATFVCIDMASNGLIAHANSHIFPNKINKGCIICNDSESFKKMILAPSDINYNIPNSTFVSTTAQFIKKRFNTDIGISIAALTSFKNEKDIINKKIFLSFSINNDTCTKSINCIGTKKTINNQLLNGLYGYFLMALKKHPIKKSEKTRR